MSEGHTSRLEAALAGRYRIERKLGEGGMASVYLAEDLKHEIGSFTVVPQPLPQMVEQLTYEFEEAAGGEPGGELLLEWENTLLRIPIEA